MSASTEEFERGDDDLTEEELDAPASLMEEVGDELDEILCSMEDLAEKVEDYLNDENLKEEHRAVLNKILAFCYQKAALTDVLEEYFYR